MANLLEGGIASGSAMLFLTNEESREGASALFYDGILDRIRDVIGGDYYILPSSIHEFVIVPGCASTGRTDELKKIVLEANRTVTRPYEILNDNVYHYDGTFKRLA